MKGDYGDPMLFVGVSVWPNGNGREYMAVSRYAGHETNTETGLRSQFDVSTRIGFEKVWVSTRKIHVITMLHKKESSEQIPAEIQVRETQINQTKLNGTYWKSCRHIAFATLARFARRVVYPPNFKS